MRIVIVGGVAGGMSAAARARRLDEPAEIIVLERGKVVERGTHASLMTASGVYARLIEAERTT